MSEVREPIIPRPEEDWAAFCDGLKAAGEIILRAPAPEADFDRAEGFRYLSRLTRLGLEKYVEHGDPVAPRFFALSHETGKIGIDNPDSYYMNAAIRGEHDYRITGRRGTVAYLGFGTYHGDYGKSGRSGLSGYLEADELEMRSDGSFEITVSSKRQPGNWLPMEPDSAMLIVRQNRLDREKEVLADLRIECLDVPGPPAPLDPVDFGQKLRAAGNYVTGTAEFFARWAESWVPHPNTLPLFDPQAYKDAHGDPNIRFHMGYWELEPDQALVIEATPPPCDYWNFQLCNYWLESLDYRYRPVHYNGHTTRYEADGSFRLVVAARDLGFANWVDTEGHTRGTMGLRWVKAPHDVDPVLRVVPLDSLG